MFRSSSKFLLLLLTIELVVAPVSAAPWRIFHDFESGTSGVAISSTAIDAAINSVYSTERAASGTKSLRMSIDAGAEGYGYWGGVIRYPSAVVKGEELWLSFDMYVPADFVFNTSNGSLKFVRITTDTEPYGTGTARGSNDFQIVDDDDASIPFEFRQIKEHSADVWLGYGSKAARVLTRNAWHKFEIYLRFSNETTGGDQGALTRFWVDGRLLSNETQMQTLSAATDVSRFLYFFTYWNGGAPRAQSLWVDNLELTNQRPTRCDVNGYPSLNGGACVKPVSPLTVIE